MNVEGLRVNPVKNHLDLFEKIDPKLEMIKYLTIGFNFKDKPLNTNQGNKAAEGLAKTLMMLPNLVCLTVWGYPISTTMEALTRIKKLPSEVRIIAGCYRTFLFNHKPGELHTTQSTFEYRNTQLLYKFKCQLSLFDDSGTPISKTRSVITPTHYSLSRFSILHLSNLTSITSFHDYPANSMTKSKSPTPCIVLPKSSVTHLFVDHKKSLLVEISSLSKLPQVQLSGEICSLKKWDFVKGYV
jgi:hypothetical protein